MKKLLFSIIVSSGLYTPQCNKLVEAHPITNAANKKTFLALGDSYTIGQSVEMNERFPALAVAMLKDSGILINAPDYIAATGWTTEELALAISNKNPSKNYDVVTVLIGVNDQFQGLDTNKYRTNFLSLLSTAIALASNRNTHVFVLSIPDYSVTTFGMQYDTKTISKEIKSFNEINRSITGQLHCNYIDITLLSREALTDPFLITYDGLHPSGKEYEKWAAKLSASIYKVLK